jgi:hypothetical protein
VVLWSIISAYCCLWSAVWTNGLGGQGIDVRTALRSYVPPLFPLEEVLNLHPHCNSGILMFVILSLWVHPTSSTVLSGRYISVHLNWAFCSLERWPRSGLFWSLVHLFFFQDLYLILGSLVDASIRFAMIMAKLWVAVNRASCALNVCVWNT